MVVGSPRRPLASAEHRSLELKSGRLTHLESKLANGLLSVKEASGRLTVAAVNCRRTTSKFGDARKLIESLAKFQ